MQGEEGSLSGDDEICGEGDNNKLGLVRNVTRFAKALFEQVGDQVDQVDQVGQGQGQELDNILIFFRKSEYCPLH